VNIAQTRLFLSSRGGHLDDLAAGIGDHPDKPGDFSSPRPLSLTLEGEEIRQVLRIIFWLGAIGSWLFPYPRFFSFHFGKLFIYNFRDLLDQLGVHGLLIFPEGSHINVGFT